MSQKKHLKDRKVSGKSGKYWEVVKIINAAGEEVEAVAPVIISASRRNDTPAFHSQWFMERLRRGYLGVLNKYVSLKNARLIVFWTKNPEPMMDHLSEIDNMGIGYYFQHTFNDYESEGLEPNLPPLEDRIATFKKLSGMIGKEKVIWRFDPLVLTDTITKEILVEKVEKLMQQLTGFTEKLVISFYRSDDYEHALKRMQANQINPRDFEGEDISFVARKLGALGKKYNIRVATCADKGDLSFYGIEHNKCIDDDLIRRVFNGDKDLMAFLGSRKNLKDPGQRNECQCIVSKDVGLNNTCANGCLYCYANKSNNALERNLKLIKNGGTGEFLVHRNPTKGLWKPAEIIVDERVKDDPVTRSILEKCPSVPIRLISDAKSDTVVKASVVHANSGTTSVAGSESGKTVLDKIIAGKKVLFVAPPSSEAVDIKTIEDDRIICPHYARLKYSSNACFYQCEWCYLKITYRGNQSYMTVYADYDRIIEKLEKKISSSPGPIVFNSGDLADSLSLEHLTGAARKFIPWFGTTEKGYLSMLTKSDNVDGLLDLNHNGHTIIGWSINNDIVSRMFETGAPPFKRRLIAAEKVQRAGYPLRIRLDPIVPLDGWQEGYANTVKNIFDAIQPERITLGTLRFEPEFYNHRNTIFRPDSKLPEILDGMSPMFESKVMADGKMRVSNYSYPEERRIEIYNFIIEEIRKHSDCRVALCKESEKVWDSTGLIKSNCSCNCTIDVDADCRKGKCTMQGQTENLYEMLKEAGKADSAKENKEKVSDDEKFEKEVLEFCKIYQNKKLSKIVNREQVFKKAKDFVFQYQAKANNADSFISGEITHYRIRQGLLFSIIKKLVKKVEKRNWKEWFYECFEKSEFRSAQDYMKLAKTPNVFQYAVFGRERLLAILRTMESGDGDDPIGAFLTDNELQFNPDEKTDLHDLKFNTDVAINYRKLQDAGFTEITKEKVEELVEKRRGIKARHINELKLAQETGRDVNDYMDEILRNNGKAVPVMTAERKSENLKNMTDRYINNIRKALEDTEYLGGINSDTLAILRQLLQQVEERIPAELN